MSVFRLMKSAFISRVLKKAFTGQAGQKGSDARPQAPREPQRTGGVREDSRGVENAADATLNSLKKWKSPKGGLFQRFASLTFLPIAVLLLTVTPGLDPAGEWSPGIRSAQSAQPSSESDGPAGRIIVATYEGVINPVAAEYLIQVIEDSTREDAEALIIRLDTPGGLDTSMRLIIKAIIAAELPVIVYVSPAGARAASAGVFITLSAHIAAMSPGTNIGAAHPVAMGGGQMDEVMKEKVENDAAAYIKSIAEKRGRNVEWAEDAVRQSVSATETEALELGIIDLIAEDLETLLTAVDGQVVETAAGERILRTHSAEIQEIEMSGRLKFLQVISNPNIAYILMLLGIYGLIFELSNPGAILPGVVGAISLILAFYSLQTLPINYAGLLLIILAIILFIAETQVPSFGLLTMGGVVAMTLGSVMLIRTDVPFLRISWWVILPTVAATAGFFVLVMGMVLRAHHRKPVTGIEAFVGAVGIAKTEISPNGRVQVRGEIWDAVSTEPIREGDPVEITGVQGLKLFVKRAQNTQGSPS